MHLEARLVPGTDDEIATIYQIGIYKYNIMYIELQIIAPINESRAYALVRRMEKKDRFASKDTLSGSLGQLESLSNKNAFLRLQTSNLPPMSRQIKSVIPHE